MMNLEDEDDVVEWRKKVADRKKESHFIGVQTRTKC